MLNTAINNEIAVLAAYINYSALAESIKAAFSNEFPLADELTDNNTICRVQKERTAWGAYTYYYVEITCIYSADEYDSDTTGQVVELTDDEAKATDELIKAAVLEALANL